MKKSFVRIKLHTQIFLLLLLIGFSSLNLTARIESNYTVNANDNLELDINIENDDSSININYLCDSCFIDFLFLDNDNYLKYSSAQSYEERLVVRDRETYSNRIFIPTKGIWLVIFENKDSFNKTLDFSYEEVDPPVTEDWIFWIMLTPWLIGFFGITGYWFYRKRNKP